MNIKSILLAVLVTVAIIGVISMIGLLVLALAIQQVLLHGGIW
jgi:hypothetical protein